MKTRETVVTQVPLGLLHPHPKNANVMSWKRIKKLRKHIEATGRYEPLVVRRHPRIEGAYELINGHHRKEVLAWLGHTHAECVVWELDDAETLLLLATINRLSGEDAPGKRLELLDALADALQKSVAEMAKLLPEDEETLAKVLGRMGESMRVEIAAPPVVEEMPEAFTVFLASGEKKELLQALAKTHAEPAVALMLWKRSMDH
jgi:ParB-like chromosome segregation protein Spo0J